MRNARTLLTIIVLFAISLAGCVASGKPKTPTPAPIVNKPAVAPAPAPPPPLSTPQTQVDLPRPQAVNEAALSPDTLPAVVEVVEPAPKTVPQPPRNRAQPPAAPPVAAPPAATPAETPTQQFQEIIPQAEAKRLMEEAQSRRHEAEQLLDQLGRRPQLSSAQKRVVTDINSFIASSKEAEARGDMKLATALAENARILAKDLTNGK
jgi:hypothetical protein